MCSRTFLRQSLSFTDRVAAIGEGGSVGGTCITFVGVFVSVATSPAISDALLVRVALAGVSRLSLFSFRWYSRVLLRLGARAAQRLWLKLCYRWINGDY